MGYDERDARARRQQALHELATEESGLHIAYSPLSPRKTPAPSRFHSRRVPRWQVLSVFLLFVIGLTCVGVGVYRGAHSGPTSAAKPPAPALTMANLPKYGPALCSPADAAWSPKSTEVAYVSPAYGCDMPLAGSPPAYGNGSLNYPDNSLLAIYDTHTGRLLQSLNPDKLITSEINPWLAPAVRAFLKANNLSVLSVLAFDYNAVLWSADGTRLALPFTLWEPSVAPNRLAPSGCVGSCPPPTLPAGQYFSGVLLVGADGSSPHVYIRLSADQQTPFAPTEWNLATGTTVALPSGLTSSAGASSTSSTPSTPIASLTWGANGILTTLPATSTTVRNGPIGNPDGGQTASIWQPGAIEPNLTSSPGNNTPSWDGTLDWTTSFSAWSPDGSYLVTNLGGSMPVPPTRDSALAAVVHQMLNAAQQYGDVPQIHSDAVAWRPDGSVLAVWHNSASNLDASHGSAADVVTFYDTRTGRQLMTLTPTLPDAPQGQEMVITLLSWSPDGTRLAMLDPTRGVLAVWGPNLPKA